MPGSKGADPRGGDPGVGTPSASDSSVADPSVGTPSASDSSVADSSGEEGLTSAGAGVGLLPSLTNNLETGDSSRGTCDADSSVPVLTVACAGARTASIWSLECSSALGNPRGG